MHCCIEAADVICMIKVIWIVIMEGMNHYRMWELCWIHPYGPEVVSMIWSIVDVMPEQSHPATADTWLIILLVWLFIFVLTVANLRMIKKYVTRRLSTCKKRAHLWKGYYSMLTLKVVVWKLRPLQISQFQIVNLSISETPARRNMHIASPMVIRSGSHSLERDYHLKLRHLPCSQIINQSVFGRFMFYIKV